MMNDRQHTMIDLHNLSEKAAKAAVVQAIREACAKHIGRIRFVTGRGNHVNSQGERGTLFKAFPEWIKEFDYVDLVEIEPEEGHYVVFIQPSKISNFAQDKLKKSARAQFVAENIVAIKARADAGDPMMQIIYADCLEEGKLFKKNEKLSADYVRRAAEAKHPAGIHQYARCWMHGIGVKQSDEKAVEWLWKGHEAGYIPSTATLAQGYSMAHPGFRYDFIKAKELHTVAAAAGVTASMRFFGAIYLNGQGVERCEKTSYEWYLRAAILGDAKAQYNIGAFWYNGFYVKKNEEKAYEYFKQSAYNGDPDAQFIYAKHLLEKGGEFKAEGSTMMMIAAENGCEGANEFIGNVAKGESAKISLERSAQAGNLLSRIQLDKLKGVESRVEDIPINEVIERFRNVGDNEVILMTPAARYILLDTVLIKGKRRDRIKAYQFVINHPLSASADSLRRLVYFYQRGDSQFSMKKNIPKVLELLRQAVDLNDPISMVMLAQYYEKDRGRERRFVEALELYCRACKLDYPPAFYYRGQLCEQGLVEAVDLRMALICFRAALALESKVGHLQKFVYGPLDQYQSISDLAKSGVQRLELLIPVEPKAPSKPNSGITPGFFNRPPKVVAPNGVPRPNPPATRPLPPPMPPEIIQPKPDNGIQAGQIQGEVNNLFFSAKKFIVESFNEVVGNFFKPPT
jgi:TPR repeat protein